MRKKIVLAFTLFTLSFYGQNTEITESSSRIDSESVVSQLPEFTHSLGDLTLRLGESDDRFIKFGLNSQVWFRSIENNPGTLVNGLPQDQTFDVGLRRMRLTMQTQLSPWYKIFLHLGINNQSFVSGGGTGTGALGMGKKPQIFFMDAYNELTIIPEKNTFTKESNPFHMYLGAGLHGVNGISRMSNASTSKILTGDFPIFNYPNIEMSDQFARQLGVFVRGQWKKWDYRFAMNKPFATNLQPQIGQIVDNNQLGKLSFNGYLMHQFLEKESTAGIFLPGFYLGTKSVFNLGVGFYSSKKATLAQPSEGVFERYDHKILSADLFLDHKVGNPKKEMALTIYSVGYHYNYGKNYLRTIGIMNPGTIDTSFSGTLALEGAGNSRNMFGTGNVWYTQTGFVLPKSISKSFKLQPFAAYTLKDLKGLNEIGHYYDFGLNAFIFSQHAKLTYQYSSRPIYESANKTVFDRKGEHLLMLQISF